jgi:mRNA-degrading endonuclease toxin of MazEF toxin-antitoxin module
VKATGAITARYTHNGRSNLAALPHSHAPYPPELLRRQLIALEAPPAKKNNGITCSTQVSICRLFDPASTSAEVPFEWRDTELTEPSVVNLDGLHTIRQRSLGHALGRLTDPELELVCSALAHALGC